MAETVHLYLKANSEDIKGTSTQTSMGRADSIECLYFEHEVLTARDAGSGIATGRRQFKPLLIRKRIDKSSPLIARAMCQNEVIEGNFKFYRPNPSGDGTTEQFYSIEILEGRIASMKSFNPDTIVPASSTMPPMEEITFVFNKITWTFEDGGVSHSDSWAEG